MPSRTMPSDAAEMLEFLEAFKRGERNATKLEEIQSIVDGVLDGVDPDPIAAMRQIKIVLELE